MTKVIMSVSLNVEDVLTLEKLAELFGVPKSAVVRDLIREKAAQLGLNFEKIKEG